MMEEPLTNEIMDELRGVRPSSKPVIDEENSGLDFDNLDRKELIGRHYT
jgi:hypothetical protein